MVSIRWGAMLSFLLLFSTLTAEGLTISHDEVGCVVAEKFARVEARFEPADDVARARVYFRAEGGSVWYYVEMKPVAGTFYGTLPKPRKSLKKLNYYVEALDKSFAEVRTSEHAPEVASDPGVCTGKLTAGALASAASVIVGGPPGAPVVPVGFSASGVTAASAAAAGAAAGAGGLGTTAVVVGAAAAAAGGIAVAASKGGGNSTPATPNSTTPATTPPTTTTTTLPPLNVTGQWAGTGPNDGSIETAGKCINEQLDVFLTLTQSGNDVSGTFTDVKRASSTDPNCGGDALPAGTTASGTITGTISSGTFTGTATVTQPPGINPETLTTTVLTNNRMQGTWTRTGSGGGLHSGTWAVNRQ